MHINAARIIASLTKVDNEYPSAKNRRSAAMWNLTGNDIEQAKEQLKGRRAAIKARYDEER